MFQENIQSGYKKICLYLKFWTLWRTLLKLSIKNWKPQHSLEDAVQQTVS